MNGVDLVRSLASIVWALALLRLWWHFERIARDMREAERVADFGRAVQAAAEVGEVRRSGGRR